MCGRGKMTNLNQDSYYLYNMCVCIYIYIYPRRIQLYDAISVIWDGVRYQIHSKELSKIYFIPKHANWKCHFNFTKGRSTVLSGTMLLVAGVNWVKDLNRGPRSIPNWKLLVWYGPLPVTVTTRVITCLGSGIPNLTFTFHCYREGAISKPLFPGDSGFLKFAL